MDFVEFFSELVRLETELWNAVDERLRAVHGLPLSRFEPMQVMERTSQCRVNDIAGALAITVGGASKLVDRIETAGLCRRRPDPDDGRSCLLELTPAGRRLLTDAARTFAAELALRLGPTMTGRPCEDFTATVRRLRQGLRVGDEVRSAGGGRSSRSARARHTL